MVYIIRPSGHADDGTSHKAAHVMAVDVALDEPLIEMRWLREKLIQVSKR